MLPPTRWWCPLLIFIWVVDKPTFESENKGCQIDAVQLALKESLKFSTRPPIHPPQACVLGLSVWPQVLIFSQRSSVRTAVLTKTQSQLHELFSLLDTASYKRLYIFSSHSEEFYLGDITSRIELAKAWVHAIAENRTGRFPNRRYDPDSQIDGSTLLLRAWVVLSRLPQNWIFAEGVSKQRNTHKFFSQF